MKIFVYTNKIFDSDLLVCVGTSAKAMKKWADKNSKPLKQIYKDESNFKATEEAMKVNNGFIQWFAKDGLKFYILWLKEFKNNWKWYDTLNHEVVHYRQYQFRDKGAEGETEFEAYFQESVFRDLRRLLI